MTNHTPHPTHPTSKQTIIKSHAVAGYSLGYKCLHWIMAALIFLMFLAGQGFSDGGTNDEKMMMLIGHSSIGTIITMLLIVRLTKRFVLRSPMPEHDLPRWQKKVAKSVQLCLYACMLLVPLSGYVTGWLHELPVSPFNLINISQSAVYGYDQETYDLARLVHETLISMMMAFLVMHIGAAVYHRLVLKDQVLASMTRGSAH